MSNDLWRWADPDGQQRKVRLDELRAALAGGLIAPNTPVWRSGWRDWQPAHEVPELTSASLGGANGVVLNIPPPPLAMVAVQQEYEAAAGSLAPAPPNPHVEEEPPPPPPYVPVPAKSPSLHPSSGQLKTQIGGSAHVPVAPGSSPTAIAGAAPSALVAPGSGSRLGSSLPTTIGVPPPPEVLATAAAGAARPRSVPPPAPPAKPRAPNAEMIEEISSSMLLDSSPSLSAGTPGSNGTYANDGLPPPTDPIVRTDGTEIATDDAEPAAFLPRRPGLSLILDDIAEIRQGRPPKNKLLIGVLAVVALSVVIMIVALIASIASGSSSETKDLAKAAASTAPSAAPPSTTAAAATTGIPATAAAPIPAPPPVDPKRSPTFGDCTATGDARTIAPRAVIASAIEAHALGDGLALAFAASPRDAVATSLDPASLAPTTTVRTKPVGGDARRVTPLLVGGKLTALPDVDRKNDHIAHRRVVAASALVDVGYADGAIVWAPHGKDSFAKLFPLEGDGPVEALRAIALTDRKGVALTFRRGNAVHIGVAKGDGVLEPEGGLSTISGLGQVGSPAIAASGGQVIAAWADRAEGDDWSIRWTSVAIGSTTTEARPFSIPGGGLGGQAMSPSLAPLGAGRFLLAWTEGPVSNHQVRAITIDATGAPSGSPIDISGSGVNAGQPAAVVGPDGRGAVAFLAARGKSLEVHATPISCPPR